jgi:hypothetical protein
MENSISLVDHSTEAVILNEISLSKLVKVFASV